MMTLIILPTVFLSVIAYTFTSSGDKELDLEPKRGSIARRLLAYILNHVFLSYTHVYVDRVSD